MFLSLALTMILSLVFTLLESARLYGLEAQSKMETELLLESKMAEYDTALLSSIISISWRQAGKESRNLVVWNSHCRNLEKRTLRRSRDS